MKNLILRKLFLSAVVGGLSSTAFATLRITEMCPRPDAMDPNGKEAGWIELQNTGDTEITLSDYALIRFNRGKKEKNSLEDDLKPFPEALGDLAPGARIVVYAGEEYDNVDKEEFKCYPVEGSTTGEQIGVFPFKVNPKNYPTVRLYKIDPALAEDSTKHTLLQTLNIPVDLEDNKSFGPGDATNFASALISEKTEYTYSVTNGGDPITGTGTGGFAIVEDVPADYVTGNTIAALTATNDTDAISSAVTEENGIYDFAAVESCKDGLLVSLDDGTTLPDGDFTASFWFKTNQSPEESTNIDGKGMVLFECRPSPGDDGRSGINLFIDGNGILRIQPRSSTGSNTNISTEGTDVTDNEWHHVVLTGGTASGDTVKLYYDGQLAISSQLSFDATFQLQYLCYGRAYNSGSWFPYIGKLRQMQFMPHALTAEEVANIYASDAALETEVTSLTAIGVSESDGEYTFTGEASNKYYVEDANTALADGETIDFWVNPTSFNGSGNEATVLMDCRDGGAKAEGYLLLCKDDGTIYVQRATSSNFTFANAPLPTNEWTHVTFTVDTNHIGTLYLNGVAVDSQEITGFTDATTTRRFGGSHDSYWRGLVGSMADIRVFGCALSEKEVAKLHNANSRTAEEDKVKVSGTNAAVATVVNVDALTAGASATATFTGTLAQAGTVTVTAETEQALELTWNGTAITSGVPFDVGTGEYTLTWSTTELTTADILITATHSYETDGVTRVIFPTMTPGADNNYTEAIPVGSQIGPKIGKKVDGTRALMGATPTAPVPAATDLPVTFTIYPLSDNGEVADENAITGVELLYVMDFGEMKTLTMTAGDDNTWTATIPGSELPEPGHLIRYAARITDGAGFTWRSPSENNLDDCPLWYGTIVQPTVDQNSATLQTFHLFADEFALTNMDKQFDTIKGSYPNGARVGIYDMQTEEYYDRVRIDLRGNTSASFNKKSHGLRFNKCHPLIFDHPFDGFEIETRKTSFTAEWPDPTFLRQSLSFHIWRNAGNLVPFHYPVRLLRNGEFYQLAFHTNRFTDELIEDYYGLDPMGYGYKNVGTFNANDLSTSAGSIEKKTPDDGDETSDVALAPLKAFAERFVSVNETTEDNADITKVVVQHFDLPAWFNYLATARITQEADDVWANISAYYDIKGTKTWMPLAYDHNLSFGQWYYNDDSAMGRIGLRPNDDGFKSHPLYGGHRIRAHKKSGDTVGRPNYAVEAVWQSSKFRRLYLRRLRTLMDEVLKEPGTAAEDTPFWEYMTTMQAAMTEDAATDRAKWGYGDSTVIYVWDKTMSLEEGLVDMWDNYVVPRRVHLFKTHSVNNDAVEIGYGAALNAGIPDAQSDLRDLMEGLSFQNATATDGTVDSFDETAGVLIIQNTNDEAIDMSGWVLEGAVEYTLPPGTVIDQQMGDTPGTLYIVADRDAYVTANEASLTDQVIVGNAEFTTAETLLLASGADEVCYISWGIPTAIQTSLRVKEVYSNTTGDGDTGEYIDLINLSTTETLDLGGVHIIAKKSADPWEDAKCNFSIPASVTLAPGATIRLDQTGYGWNKLTNNKVDMKVYDADGVLVQTLYFAASWWKETDGLGASLIAQSYEKKVLDKSDWEPSFRLSASRDVSGEIDWTAENAWTQTVYENGEIVSVTQGAPTEELSVEVTATATTTVNLNHDGKATYAELTLSGEAITFVSGSGTIAVDGMTTIGANVTIPCDAIELNDVTVQAGKTLTIDVSTIDLTTFYEETVLEFMGDLTLEDGATVAFINIPSKEGYTVTVDGATLIITPPEALTATVTGAQNLSEISWAVGGSTSGINLAFTEGAILTLDEDAAFDAVTFAGTGAGTVQLGEEVSVSAATLTVNTDMTLPATLVNKATTLTIATDKALTVDVPAETTVTLNKALSGDYTFKKSGAGTLILGGNINVNNGVEVLAGTLKFGAGVIPHKSGNYPTTDAANVTVHTGATFDVNGVADAFLNVVTLHEGATFANDGSSELSNGSRQLRGITLEGNATVRATKNFGIIAGGYADATLALNGHTLTKTGGGKFWLASTAVSGGTLKVDEGSFEVRSGYAGSFTDVTFQTELENAFTLAGAPLNGTIQIKAGTGTITFDENISGDASLAVMDGTLKLTGENSLTGTMSIAESATVVVGNGSALNTPVTGSGTVQVNIGKYPGDDSGFGFADSANWTGTVHFTGGAFANGADMTTWQNEKSKFKVSNGSIELTNAVTGTLIADDTGSVNSALTLAAGATIDAAAGAVTVTGAVTANGTVKVVNSKPGVPFLRYTGDAPATPETVYLADDCHAVATTENGVVTLTMLHVVEPEVSDEVTEEVAAEALQTVVDHLKANASAAAKAIETITNPAALTVIADPNVTIEDEENGKASVTFTYEFGVSKLSVVSENGELYIIATVQLGDTHAFVDGTTVSLVDVEDEDVPADDITDNTTLKSFEGRKRYFKFKMPNSGGAFRIKAKAEKKGE